MIPTEISLSAESSAGAAVSTSVFVSAAISAAGALVSAAGADPPQPTRRVAAIATLKTALINFFFISFPPYSKMNLYLMKAPLSF